jgi:hypothetical protein
VLADLGIDTQLASLDMDNEEEEDKPEEGGDMRSSEVLDQVSAMILDSHGLKGLSRFAYL